MQTITEEIYLTMFCVDRSMTDGNPVLSTYEPVRWLSLEVGVSIHHLFRETLAEVCGRFQNTEGYRSQRCCLESKLGARGSTLYWGYSFLSPGISKSWSP